MTIVHIVIDSTDDSIGITIARVHGHESTIAAPLFSFLMCLYN